MVLNNNLRNLEKELRSIAKRCKDIKYTRGFLLCFLLMGMLSFSSNLGMYSSEIKKTRENLNTSIADMKKIFKKAKYENSKLLNQSNLELIQLTEQGDHVVKSPWNSWQYGMNYFYNNWRGIYKGKGDKRVRYPYEGLYQRSSDLFLRNISPDSNAYAKYTAASKEKSAYPATTSAIVNQRLHYGLENSYIQQEPILTIELGASVKPKEVGKSNVEVKLREIKINQVVPLSTPATPESPTLPIIDIPEFSPVAPDPINVSLPTPPTFNIKLGAFCNPMCDGGGAEGRAYSPETGVATKLYNVVGEHNLEIPSNAVNNPSLRYSWSNVGSVLFKVYADYTSDRTYGGTGTLKQNLIIDSINPLSQAQRQAEANAAASGDIPGNRTYNAQNFLVGGSRVLTMDNVINGKLRSQGEINLVGPLVVGFEIQTDTLPDKGTPTTYGIKEIINEGTITDEAEEGYRGNEGLGGLKVGKSDGSVTSNSIMLNLAPKLGGGSINVTRTPDEVDGSGNVLKNGGYTGYKIGMILTYENDDDRNTSDYRLINNRIIKFNGKSSIGIQVYAPGSPKSHITVQNNKTITMGGIESYGLKLSSRVSDEKMTFENGDGGTINISGLNKSGNSLSSGIAILEDSTATGTDSIRTYKGKVKNKGTINVSGGQGNTGMVMILRADDDITNETGTLIDVRGTKNIGMRVDLGKIATDDSGILTPEAINKGKIAITGGTGNIGMVANKSETGGHKAIAVNDTGGEISFWAQEINAIGMFSQNGAEVVNKGLINHGDSGAFETIGMVINDKDSSGKNTGNITLSGNKVTGVYNNLGKFEMTDGSVKTSGEKSISLYAKGNGTVTSTETKITKGTITAENRALGLFADRTTVELGDSSTADTVTLNAKGVGTLLFYNYTGGTNSAEGIFKLNNSIKGNLTNGATAFYFKDTTPGKTSGQTSGKLDAMFTGSVSGKKINLKLDEKSTLFVLDNTRPNTSYIGLSSVDISQINDFLGSHVNIDGTSSPNFKAYKATKASLAINTDVNLDNHTGSAIDKYYRVDFLNSSVRIDAGKTVKGTDGTAIAQAIAQANYNGSASSGDVKVENNGTIDFSKRNATAIVVDFAEAKNNGKIIMDAANTTGENSIAIFGSSGSKLENTDNGTIELGKNGVGIWGANKIGSSVSTWSKDINITNAGTIRGISGKEGIFGIYAVNDKASYPSAASNITHSGNINFSGNSRSTGIFMKNGILNSKGNISVKEGSIGVNATDSVLNVSAGTYTIGKESVGFKLLDNSSGAVPITKFIGSSGNINITGSNSVVYLLEGRSFTSGAGGNFVDNLSLTSSEAYTYINAKNTTLNYKNTKTVNNNETIFLNSYTRIRC